MKKILISFLLTSSLCFAQSIHVGVLMGPSGIPMANMMENSTSTNNKKIEYELFSQANYELPKLLKNEIQIGFLPVNAACKVYNSNKKIVSAAICGNQMVSLITKDKNIKSLKDLENKKINVAGMGATPDFLIQYLLEENKTRSTLDYSIPAPQLAAAIIENKIEYAVVPEPFATVASVKDKEIFKAIEFKNEFSKELPMTLLVINADFAKENKKFIKKFINEYKKALNETIKNPAKTGELTEKSGIGLNAKITEKAIPECAWTFVEGKNQKEKVEELLKIFEKINSSSFGDAFPEDEFYFE